MNLRTKFITVFLLLTLLPLVAFGIVAFVFVQQNHAQNVEKIQTQFVELTRKEVERFVIEETANILQLEAPQPHTILPLSCERERLLELILAANPAIQEVGILSAPRFELGFEQYGDVGFPQEEAGCTSTGVSDILQPATEIVRFSRTRGTYEGVPRNLAETQEFRIPASGKVFIGEPYYTLSGPMVTVSAPAYNSPSGGEQRVILFITVAEVELTPLAKRLSRQKLGTSGYFVLLDTKGRALVFSGNGEVVGKRLTPLSDFARTLRTRPLPIVQHSDSYQGLLGQEVLGAGASIAAVGNWLILSEWPTSEANAVLSTTRFQIALFSIIAAIAVLIVSFLAARAIVGPIRVLARGAKDIGEGKFEKKIAIHTGDELEELSGAFNEMAKGLKRLDELRKEFVFIATHELRAPVTAIKGYLSLIQEDAPKVSEDVDRSLGRIKEANDNLVQLVDDLLEVARAEAGRIRIDLAPQDMYAVAEKVVGTLRVLAEQRGIALTLEQQQTPLSRVLADADKLREVLMNLVSNAIKYNRDGGSVTVHWEQKDGMLATHISDTGIGMTTEEQQHLFEKFWRAEAKESREQIGTGLGLFIVKQIVERMDGKIWVTSEKGRGSTFSFSLPMARESA